MKYNPKIHHRKSIRLKGYDYSRAGMYFITICCHNREMLFGEIINGQMILTGYGKIAFDEWLDLLNRFASIALDEFVIMPNHMHGIIIIKESDDSALEQETETAAAKIGDIVGGYKSLVAKKCLEIFKNQFPRDAMGKLWQRNYFEHIIRNESSYHKIAAYIADNPASWQDDKFFTP